MEANEEGMRRWGEYAHTHAHWHTHVGTYVHTHVQRHACICTQAMHSGIAHVCVSRHTPPHTQSHICMCSYIHAQTHSCLLTSAHSHMHTHANTFAHTCTCMHTQAHTDRHMHKRFSTQTLTCTHRNLPAHWLVNATTRGRVKCRWCERIGKEKLQNQNGMLNTLLFGVSASLFYNWLNAYRGELNIGNSVAAGNCEFIKNRT